MKLFAIALSLSLASLTGCASQTPDTDSSSDELEAAPAPVLWCFVPADHHDNGVDEVFTVDVSSTFVHPHTRLIDRRSGFFSHGDLVGLVDRPSTATWTSQSQSSVDGSHFTGHSDASAIQIDLTGDSGAAFSLHGTARVTYNDQPDDEVVNIVRGGFCPR